MVVLPFMLTSSRVSHTQIVIVLRCQEAMEDGLVQVRELQRQLQRLRKEQEELEERNEELEALLGEAQNASKEESHRHEGELEGLHRRVINNTGSKCLLNFSKWQKIAFGNITISLMAE